ncbi:hypothetical protein EVAR_85630_1 [Eumeta japonica]|uniref:Uncharacterized protein n=1 Tax=Eumeta variegata TaxID=151549 RepID=A0A4C1XV70_EUMVA|nr:hypothetical protein EVAR_85630_1 [Eumeta japonica]
MKVRFLSMVRPRRRISPTKLICLPFMCTTGLSYFRFLISTSELVFRWREPQLISDSPAVHMIEGILRPALRRKAILRRLQLRHYVPFKAPD